MIKKTRTIITSLLVAMFVTTALVGCNSTDIITNVLQKTYTLVVNTQKYVSDFDEQQVIANISLLKTPIGAVASALDFSLNYINNEGLSSQISTFTKILKDLIVQIENVDPQNATDLKNNVISVLVDAQTTLQDIGAYFGAEIKVTFVKSGLDIDTLIGMSNDLNDLIAEQKK